MIILSFKFSKSLFFEKNNAVYSFLRFSFEKKFTSCQKSKFWHTDFSDFDIFVEQKPENEFS